MYHHQQCAGAGGVVLHAPEPAVLVLPDQGAVDRPTLPTRGRRRRLCHTMLLKLCYVAFVAVDVPLGRHLMARRRGAVWQVGDRETSPTTQGAAGATTLGTCERDVLGEWVLVRVPGSTYPRVCAHCAQEGPGEEEDQHCEHDRLDDRGHALKPALSTRETPPEQATTATPPHVTRNTHSTGERQHL